MTTHLHFINHGHFFNTLRSIYSFGMIIICSVSMALCASNIFFSI